MTRDFAEWHWSEAKGSLVETVDLGAWWTIGLRASRGDVNVRIAGAVTLVLAGGEVEVTTSAEAEARLPLLALRGAVVGAVVASSSGALRIATRNGTILIDPHVEFEAWELDGCDRNGEFFIACSTRNGGLQIFDTPPLGTEEALREIRRLSPRLGRLRPDDA